MGVDDRSARAIWSAGNYDAVANGVWEVGEAVVRRAGVRAGDRVLDVGCGTGNAAIRAALAGGRVTGLDVTTEMFEAARRRAAEARVEVVWIEGDAEALPFEDGAFDVVLSTFGAMFASRHELAAAEMARVLRAGGRIGMATWDPEGSVGQLFHALDEYLPRAGAPSPMLWGSETHVRRLFEGTGIELVVERRRLRPNPDVDVDRGTEFYLGAFGPIVNARRILEPSGRWPALEQELRPVIGAMLLEPPEYLLFTGTKR